jgi:hypothetical protein
MLGAESLQELKLVGFLSIPCADIEPIDIIETELFIDQVLFNDKSKFLVEDTLQGLCSDSRGLYNLSRKPTDRRGAASVG